MRVPVLKFLMKKNSLILDYTIVYDRLTASVAVRPRLHPPQDALPPKYTQAITFARIWCEMTARH